VGWLSTERTNLSAAGQRACMTTRRICSATLTRSAGAAEDLKGTSSRCLPPKFRTSRTAGVAADGMSNHISLLHARIASHRRLDPILLRVDPT
jgi:hypothetical protein